ncbi:MAG TPA: CHAD domain-containing protein [Bacteroidia bacterium]|nr:CHAD domain-containing protein [Bacteroidia bacterium]
MKGKLGRKFQEEIFSERCQNIVRLLRSYRKKHSQETIHRLRVELKRVNAFFILFDPQRKGRPGKTFASFRRVFRKAGKIRSAYIHLQVLHDLKTPSGPFIENLRTSMLKDARRFAANAAKRAERIGKYPRLFAHAADGVKTEKIVRFFEKEMAAIGRKLKKDTGEESLHDLRARMKNLLYLHSFLPGRLVEKIRMDTSYLHSLQDEIGKWHDVLDTIKVVRRAGGKSKSLENRLSSEADARLKDILLHAADFHPKITGR